MLRFSAQLPVREFFKYSSWLIAVLAVVLAGKGVSALQEAGIIDIAPLAHMPRIPVLGLFPTWQSIGAQFLTIAVIVAGDGIMSGWPARRWRRDGVVPWPTLAAVQVQHLLPWTRRLRLRFRLCLRVAASPVCALPRWIARPRKH
jgi:hypothetical protein